MMDRNTAIEFENVGKQYRLGLVGTGTLQHDLNRWWQTSVLGREDPYLKIGDVNDRTRKGGSEYVWSLKDISFKVERGEVVGIIGKNGAGKSTLLKLLSRITAPSTGIIRYRGRIASLLEVGTGFHPEMTARENIYMNGAIMGMSRAEISGKFDEIIDFAGVGKYVDTPVKRFSSGMTVRLGFAVAAFLEPEILVVDEVLAVGDAEFQKKAIGKIKDVTSKGSRTVLFVSHNMDSIQTLCTRGILLENGLLKYDGDVRSAIGEYLSGAESNRHFIQELSRNQVFVKDVHFVGDDNQKNGLFSFSENVRIRIRVEKTPGCVISPSAVASIGIINNRGIRLCTTERSIAALQDRDSITFDIKYPPCVLLSGSYIVDVALRIPRVCILERKETVMFNIVDDGSEKLSNRGAINGVVYIDADVETI